MKRGNVTPLYPSQQRQAAALKARLGSARILLLEAMCSWRRQQLIEHAQRQAARKRAS